VSWVRSVCTPKHSHQAELPPHDRGFSHALRNYSNY